MNLIQSSDSAKCKTWLESKPPSSVIYISFGSFDTDTLSPHQVSALTSALLSTKKPFLWIIRSSEQHKLPEDFVCDNKQGLILSWSQQLAVLAHESIRCFVTHCGWNSTLEALNRGVPMVAMPQWTDHPRNAKYVEDFWRVGVRARAREGFIDDFEIERCVQEVMEVERSGEMRENARRWKAAVEAAVREGVQIRGWKSLSSF
ncbi:uncharacterized protein A4U43_C08F23810 [Asparagus officinalis]|uniref:crocetin glucosyltransferase 2-like n=1 Tax=Asparagus officinalis TaxID=4686 RepID=UPI00098E4F0B|nr:crocetin glucosyltransferase 2-like [Asparagus officinalis]ONK60894.1 uncharacterized protein A4U43_C08F23810 [Asparagus officinalis]